ncbi:MFS transporter [Marinobacter sp. F4218]|uniref:MFS transporter n=1 Tax=Marinobacter sp. F4218 TaxID=2862868 RepID=UPI001C6285A7|nr:MFS transporter [Marinobacter sp. F4218]MBW7470316.1 MFS transporter [Marinobacter sp. F4218]
MAENQRTAPPVTDSGQGAVLRPGRAADPLPSTVKDPAQSATPPAMPAGAPAQPSIEETPPVETAPTDDESAVDSGDSGHGEASDDGVEQTVAYSRQRQLRLMLRQCDRILLMDFDQLAMTDWPDNYTLAVARRRRDLWLFTALVAALVFLSGLTGFVPAWVAGTGFGAFVIILLLGIPSVRRIYASSPSYLEVVMKRQRMLRDARAHAAHLEASDGLIWQCARMADFNPALKNTRFSNLLRLSEQRVLARRLTRREHVRMYLIYLLEAEKAYERVQKAFFEGNQQAIDRGWQGVAAEPEPRT